MNSATLMIQGTTSDAGKSILVAGLCRVLSRRGVRVCPFKPQNMALNSAVTQDGGEIGRAQAVQAEAAGLEPHTDMNPVLLKPNSDIGAQVIIHGQVIDEMNAVDYHQYKTIAMQAVLESYQRLQQQYQVILVEGAGSPAEINLRDHDIANMGFAEAADCPVILIADIDRGGVFAHIVGTLKLLSPSEQARIKGTVINRFRGDLSLLTSGLEWLESYTKKPVVGVLPFLQGLHLQAEDSLLYPIDNSTKKVFNVIVPALPRISNHTDMDALRMHEQIQLQFIGPNQAIPDADLIILPGSKSVCADMQWLREQGWPAVIERHLRYGGKLIGICGGFQMLGKAIHDPLGIEAEAGSVNGLGYLNMTTTLGKQKTLANVTGTLSVGNAALSGYMIHHGISAGPALDTPSALLDTGQDGCLSEDGQILGSYVHGLFDSPAALQALMRWAGLTNVTTSQYQQIQRQSLDRLADAIEDHLDMKLIDFLLKL